LKYWVQIATIGSTLTLGTFAAAQDDVAPQAVVLPPEPPHDRPREAPPSPPPAVGGEGRWVFDVLGGQLGGPTSGLAGTSALGGLGFLGPLVISNISNESSPAGVHTTSKTTVIALAPSVDVFVTEHFSFGAQIAAGTISASSEAHALTVPSTSASPDYSASMRGYTLRLAPRIGYAIPLSSVVALWPRLGVGYEVSRLSVDDNDVETVNRTYSVESILGVGIRVSKHAFFDVGPVLSYQRSSSDASSGTPTVNGPVVPGSSEAFGGSVRASLRLDF
jgi:hypothetical protein